jgi:two-component system, response regulator YesN
MYRILVLDDEPFIVEGLYTLISDIQDIELDIYKAHSAKEALQWMNKIKIDIVLSDINMPNMTGLELQKEIISQWPLCKVIFLTGYNEFEYVQEAIRQGAFDYVLKIEKDDVIVNTVKRAIDAIDNDLKNELLITNARVNMRSALPLIRERYLLDILHGQFENGEERKKRFIEMSIHLKPTSPVLLFVGRVDDWSEDIDYIKKLELIYGIQSIVSEYIQRNSTMIPVIYDKDHIIWFLQPKELLNKEKDINEEVEQWERFILFVHGNMDSIQVACKRLYGISTSFIVSSTETAWKNITEKFDNLKLALNKAGAVSNGAIIIDNVFQESEKSKDEDHSSKEHLVRNYLKKVNLLETFLDGSQKEEFIRTFDEIMNSVKENNLTEHSIAFEVYYTVSNMFVSYLSRNNLAESIGDIFDIRRLPRLGKEFTWENIHDFFKKLSENIFEHKKTDFTDKTDKVIMILENYIDRNLHGDISLVKLSDLVHFNATYLSRFYKHATGRSISDYISEAKIIKAKEMLANSKYKINEVAAAVGFDNSSYFSRFFRKHTNLNPNEYRDTL